MPMRIVELPAHRHCASRVLVRPCLPTPGGEGLNSVGRPAAASSPSPSGGSNYRPAVVLSEPPLRSSALDCSARRFAGRDSQPGPGLEPR